MKSRTLVCALTAASMLASPLTFAQGYDRGGDNRSGYQQRDRDARTGDRRGPQRADDFRRDGRRSDGVRGDRRDGRVDQYYYGARGPGWRRGGRVPQLYRSPQYVVNDWRGHHLNAPAHGYHWVQVGGDYVLVAIATGIILQLLLNQ